ncbi:[FeFe] hydrogenase, group A [Intestinibacillus massiliensis]|uniref:[FeFe] hydrogenase, group A n=1 Tax=Intestinibacillus massiliensis TaxID=1871029 RepID=UPI000B34F6D3|nr:[FeFe] hydrogenase, group A [Intestinibacillus massiliensis]
MVNLTINGKNVRVPEGTTIMDAAASVGISIPSLCYLKGINEIGACRVCCVEVKGEAHMVPSCNNPVKEGMEVLTNSPRARATRRVNVGLILSQHDCRCATCVRSGTCKLQRLANDLGILDTPYAPDLPRTDRHPWPAMFPLQRDPRKCIKCVRCVQVCDKIQSLNIWELTGSGGRTTVDVSLNRRITDADCSLCGQCITHCPTGALRERDDTQHAFDALANPHVTTVVQIAPAVRTAWGEPFGLPPEQADVGRLVTALRQVGFDYIFDTVFSADLTIMEEGSEFLRHFREGKTRIMPLFTSCCPGWVRFLKSQFPEYTPCLSTAKSPQQMFGAVSKSYFAQKAGVDPRSVYSISIMPCLAKKAECSLPTMHDPAYGADVDLVLTTRELDRLLRAEHLPIDRMPPTPPDSPLGTGTGAGAIFGATGGVMEAALRSAYFLATGKNPAPDAFQNVRGMDGWREAEFDLAGDTVRCAVAHGLGNARRLLEALRTGDVHYDFVEVMACPGGCVGGGGQPILGDDQERAADRAAVLYGIDRRAPLRFSHENPEVLTLYRDYLNAPLSEMAEHFLHTDHEGWEMPAAPIRPDLD